jgi:hypothetical protein
MCHHNPSFGWILQKHFLHKAFAQSARPDFNALSEAPYPSKIHFERMLSLDFSNGTLGSDTDFIPMLNSQIKRLHVAISINLDDRQAAKFFGMYL